MSDHEPDRESSLQTIAFLENKWLPVLIEECNRCFLATYLPSHDCSHHSRVWKYARQIILTNGILLTAEETEILLLACFFHDTGMSIDPGPRHGQFSSKLCSDFLQRTGLTFSGADILLSIVAEHDQKDNTEETGGENMKSHLLALLHMADDLDAFGATGVYRYTEIYLIRGIASEKIPGLILPNLKNRFDRIQKMLPVNSRFFQTQYKRFLYTLQFFSDCLNSPAGLVDFAFLTEKIASFVLEQKLGPLRMAKEIIHQADAPVLIRQWAIDFEKETDLSL